MRRRVFVAIVIILLGGRFGVGASEVSPAEFVGFWVGYSVDSRKYFFSEYQKNGKSNTVHVHQDGTRSVSKAKWKLERGILTETFPGKLSGSNSSGGFTLKMGRKVVVKTRLKKLSDTVVKFTVISTSVPVDSLENFEVDLYRSPSQDPDAAIRWYKENVESL